jgi:hypothetical protein
MANNISAFSNTILGFDIADIQTELQNVTTPVIQNITPFDAFESRFFNVPSPNGTIVVPLIGYTTGSQTNTGTGTLTYGTATATSVTLSGLQDWYQIIPFNPTEVQTAGIVNLARYIDSAMYSIDSQALSASYAVAANFATSSVHPASGSSATFGIAQGIAINADLSKKGINGRRILALNYDYYWNGLLADLATKNNTAGAQAIQSGSPNNPLGMLTVESQFAFAGTNTVGLTGTKGGIILGTAIPNVVHANGTAAVLISPRSGMPMLIEQYFNENTRQHMIGASVLGQAAAGNSCLLRITSV